ncbi:MAG: hypothetical protein ACOCVR_02735 [Myxococcota bacterium]
MCIRTHALVVMCLLLAVSKAGSALASEERWRPAGWQRVPDAELPHTGKSLPILQGLGTATAPITDVVRLESAMLVDRPARTIANVLSVRVALDGAETAFSLRAPLILDAVGGRLASGDIMLELHHLSATPHGRSFGIRTWRLVLPAATADLRLPVLDLEQLGGGVEWAQGRFYVSPQWLFHYEYVIGVRVDPDAPFRAAARSTAAVRIVKPVFLYAQLDSRLVDIDAEAEAFTFALGMRLELGFLEAVFAMQRGLGELGERSLLFSLTF